MRAVSVLCPKFCGQDNILPQLLGESTPWIGLKKTQNNFQKTFPREQRFPSCLAFEVVRVALSVVYLDLIGVRDNKPRERLFKRFKP